MRVCTRCGDNKHKADFYRVPRGLDGLAAQCKSCSKLYQKTRYQVVKDAKPPKQTKHRKLSSGVLKIRHDVRRRIRYYMKRAQSIAAIRDTGIDAKTLQVYLNLDCFYKYNEPYTGNEGKYHIDHIMPLCSFDLSDKEQILQAVHWTNLQILTACDNRRKGSK